MRKKSISIFIFFILFFPLILFAAEEKEQKKESPGKLLFYLDFYNGYDNNVNLDSSSALRREDTFTELDLELGYEYPLGELTKLKIGYYLNSMNYHKINDATSYDNNIAIGFTRELRDIFTLTINHNFESLYYPDNTSGNYLCHDSKISLRHDIKEWIYQKLSYDFIFKDFDKQRAWDELGSDKDKRKDLRHCATHELGLWFKDTSIKLRNRYYRNDSNDDYMDYYDYSSYRVSLSVSTPLISDKLYSVISGGYQRKEYDERLLIDNSRTQKDDSYDLSTSLYYDINKTTSLSLNYNYAENNSNEPSEKYCGSTISLGIHYAF